MGGKKGHDRKWNYKKNLKIWIDKRRKREIKGRE